MPILKHEDDIYPDNLLDNSEYLERPEYQWWCVYTVSRREKELMRVLSRHQIGFYGPVISKRYRAPNGRLRTSYIPLFPNYVFLFCSDDERYEAMKSNCISKCTEIKDQDRLVYDLRQIKSVIETGVALTPEARLETGNRVRVKTGPFAGHEGTVIRREGRTRLLLSIDFLEQGVSMEMDEGLLEPC